MAAPSVSVVVIVRDGAAGLRKLLGSLAAQTLPKERFETVVVDNDSRDDSARVARELGARVVSEPIPSRARARNAGFAAAAAERVAFIDADCIADPGWLEALEHMAGSASLVAGEVRTTTRAEPNAVERFERLSRFGQEAWVRRGWAATANLLVTRPAFEAVNGFDTAYRIVGEDADFCLRAGLAGHRLAYCGAAVVNHPAEHRLWPMLKRTFWQGYSSAQVAERLGAGYVAWRHPRPLLRRDVAATMIGIVPARVPAGDWTMMRRLARAAYAARVAGSLWRELRRAD